jgi:WD40 repeat protein
MFIARLKNALVMFMAAELISSGSGVFAKGTAVAEASQSERGEALSPAAEKQKQPNTRQAWTIGATLQGHGDKVLDIAFSPDGKRFASSGADKSIIVWDLAKRESVHTLSHAGRISSLAISDGGKTLISASGFENEDYLIHFWDLETGKERAVLKGHKNPVSALSLSQDRKILLSANGSFEITGVPDNIRERQSSAAAAY